MGSLSTATPSLSRRLMVIQEERTFSVLETVVASVACGYESSVSRSGFRWQIPGAHWATGGEEQRTMTDECELMIN